LTKTAADRLPIVEEVVATLTSAAGAGHGGAAALRAGMRRASDQFDENDAAAIARALVETLCRNPDDLRVLETLVILGLAHPGALSQHRISLATEGRRLATLLERGGQYERAYCVGELIAEQVQPELGGPTKQEAEVVAQLIRDAEFAAARGRNEAAIRCLQEALHIDPSRQDIAAAIRDLRRKREYRKSSALRAVRIAFLATVFSGVVTAVTLREYRIWGSWKALPTATSDDLAGMRARLAGIEALLDQERYWMTMPLALLQKDVLAHDIELLSRPAVPIVTDVPGGEKAASAQASPYAQADAARDRGLDLAQKGLVVDALAELRHALEIAPADWPYRSRVEANVAALESWMQKNPGRTSR
jgi:tetratricopeptide (TPR) repeat protein